MPWLILYSVSTAILAVDGVVNGRPIAAVFVLIGLFGMTRQYQGWRRVRR